MERKLETLGRYQLIRKLADGGMAELYLAKATGARGFEKTVVIKRIHAHLADAEPQLVERFFEEAHIVSRLNHPNIVQIFDCGESHGQPFLAMEYVDGSDLRSIATRTRLSDVLCARIIASVCEALEYAHSFRDPDTGQPLEIVHRDVSPDNILVSKTGAVKLTDFGIARMAGQVHRTKVGTITGKLSYMAPELLRGIEADRRSDVYSLGAVLYRVMTGKMPFEAVSDDDIIRAIVLEPLIPITRRRSDIPEALQRVVERALTKDRDARYPTVRAMQWDLEQFILSTGEPVGPLNVATLFGRSPESNDKWGVCPPPGILTAPRTVSIPKVSVEPVIGPLGGDTPPPRTRDEKRVPGRVPTRPEHPVAAVVERVVKGPLRELDDAPPSDETILLGRLIEEPSPSSTSLLDTLPVDGFLSETLSLPPPIAAETARREWRPWKRSDVALLALLALVASGVAFGKRLVSVLPLGQPRKEAPSAPPTGQRKQVAPQGPAAPSLPVLAAPWSTLAKVR